MRNKIILILTLAVIIMGVALYFVGQHAHNLRVDRDRLNDNIYAMEQEQNGRNIQYEMTIKDLKNSHDSINRNLVNVIDSLGIKLKKLEKAGVIYSEVFVHDTIAFSDTIFVKGIDIDTVVGDEWATTRVRCSFPNKISTAVSAKSEKYVIFATKRETINKPRKFFLFRLFQKKRTITEITVVEKNPYIDNTNNRFINITDD